MQLYHPSSPAQTTKCSTMKPIYPRLLWWSGLHSRSQNYSTSPGAIIIPTSSKQFVNNVQLTNFTSRNRNRLCLRVWWGEETQPERYTLHFRLVKPEIKLEWPWEKIREGKETTFTQSSFSFFDQHEGYRKRKVDENNKKMGQKLWPYVCREKHGWCCLALSRGE